MKLNDIVGRKVEKVENRDRELVIELSGGVRLRAKAMNCAPCEWTGSEGIKVAVRKVRKPGPKGRNCSPNYSRN